MQCYTAVITPLNQCSFPMGCMTISLTIDASLVSWAVTSHRGTEGEHFGISHAHNAWTCLLCNATTAAWKDNARVDWRVTPWCNSHVIDGEMLWLSWAEGEAEKPNCSATTEDAPSWNSSRRFSVSVQSEILLVLLVCYFLLEADASIDTPSM